MPRDRPRQSARQVAYEALLRIDHDGAYANLVVPAMLGRSSLSDQDRRFVTDLVYGTTRMRRACEYLVERFVLTEPDPEVRTLLRLGAYQLAFGGTARHAAVGETVELAHLKVRGFVNAVLRRVADANVSWPDDATRLSYPDWILDRFIAELGEMEGLAALECMNEPPPVHERNRHRHRGLPGRAGSVPGLNGATPPSEKLNIAGVGVSGQGRARHHPVSQPQHRRAVRCGLVPRGATASPGISATKHWP